MPKMLVRSSLWILLWHWRNGLFMKAHNFEITITAGIYRKLIHEMTIVKCCSFMEKQRNTLCYTEPDRRLINNLTNFVLVLQKNSDIEATTKKSKAKSFCFLYALLTITIVANLKFTAINSKTCFYHPLFSS